MLKVAIFGYGRLRQCLERVFEQNEQTQLTAIFSRRKLAHAKYVSSDALGQFEGKIDVIAIATGSKDDVGKYAEQLSLFNTVDSYDVHACIGQHKQLLYNKDNLSIVSVGWDPGILSIQRAIAYSLNDSRVTTFWGRGVSQGHSNAIKSIEGVKDAIQFTVPVKTAVRNALKGKFTDPSHSHLRECYVWCDSKDCERIAREIKEMPYYFKGYKVKINFTDAETVAEKWKETAHSGLVVASGDGWNMQYSVKAESNPMFTAQIMCSYVTALPQLLKDGYRGCVDCLDIPMRYLVKDKSMI